MERECRQVGVPVAEPPEADPGERNRRDGQHELVAVGAVQVLGEVWRRPELDDEPGEDGELGGRDDGHHAEPAMPSVVAGVGCDHEGVREIEG